MAILLYDCLLINNIYRPKNKILFWSVREDHGRSQVNLFLIYFIKRIVNVTEDRKFYGNMRHLLIKRNILAVSLIRIVSFFECCKTIPYEFIWILVLVLLQYGYFSYNWRISWWDGYWRRTALLGGRLSVDKSFQL